MFMLTASAIQSNVDELNNKVDKLTEITDGIMDKLIDFGFNLLWAILIFIAGRIALKLIRKLVNNISNKSNVDIGVVKFFDSLIKIIGYIVIVIIICGQVGIQTTSFITLLGTAGLSIGLALQGSLSNFAGGVLVLLTKPFIVGDYILINDVEGTVQRIDIIYTTLTTNDNKSIKIPNGIISNSVLINATRQTKRRVDVEVGIHYEDDIKKAKDIATKAMNDCEYILSDEINEVVVKSLGENKIILEVRMWTMTEDYANGIFYLNEALKEGFVSNGIRIPYNQLEVNVHQNGE